MDVSETFTICATPKTAATAPPASSAGLYLLKREIQLQFADILGQAMIHTHAPIEGRFTATPMPFLWGQENRTGMTFEINEMDVQNRAALAEGIEPLFKKITGYFPPGLIDVQADGGLTKIFLTYTPPLLEAALRNILCKETALYERILPSLNLISHMNGRLPDPHQQWMFH